MTMSDVIKVPIYQSTYFDAPSNYTYQFLVGSIVMIVSGRGMGQYRFLASAGYDADRAPVTIDRAWDVEPDSTSTIAISKFKGRFILTNNNFQAEGIHMWHWFSASDIIYADNNFGAIYQDLRGVFYNASNSNTWKPANNVTSFSITGGFRFGDVNFPGFHCGAWYNQALNNTIISASSGLDMTIGTSGNPGTNSNLTWGKQVSFGNVFRGIINPANRTLTISLNIYVGSAVVENAFNTTSVSFYDLQSMVVFRRIFSSNRMTTFNCNSKACNGTRCTSCQSRSQILLN
jgi:hypothetical protein